MNYQISLSRLFKEDQIKQINEFDSFLNVKRINQTIEMTAKNLDKMEKSGISIEPTRMKVKVPNTKYILLFKIKVNPKKVLIVNKVLKKR